MALIEPIAISCPTFELGARGYEICLPGGACISAQTQDLWASQDELCRALLAQLQGIMAPLKPIYDIVGAVLCIKDIVDAVPDAITELDPAGVAEAIETCAPKIAQLLQLIPQVSAPTFIAQLLDLLICVLDGAITELQRVIQKQAEIEALAAVQNGTGDPLLDILECANRLNQQRLCAVNEGLGPINSIIMLLNIFLELIGLDPLPTFGEMAADATNAIDQLRIFIAVLRKLKNSLGIPIPALIPRC